MSAKDVIPIFTRLSNNISPPLDTLGRKEKESYPYIIVCLPGDVMYKSSLTSGYYIIFLTPATPAH